MKTVATKTHKVVRTTNQTGFTDVFGITFIGCRTRNGAFEQFSMTEPNQLWRKKDGTVTITNNYGGRCRTGILAKKETVFNFVPQTITYYGHDVAFWDHSLDKD